VVEGIEVRRGGDTGVATVALVRPERRNAVTLAMWRALKPLFEELGADPAVRAVILTGRGGHFCAGADISEFAALRTGPEAVAAYEAAGDGATAAIRDCPKPTIAAVSGFGVGGGCGIALACDLRVGDATTRMGIPAAQRGLVYGTLDTGLLMRAAGAAGAKMVLFTARCLRRRGLPAPRAAGRGWPEEGETALEAAEALAAEIAANAPISVAGSKFVIEAMAAGQEGARAAAIHAWQARATASDRLRRGEPRLRGEAPRPLHRGLRRGMLWLGIDVGGTFTDLTLYDAATGRLTTAKTPSTPADQSEGILNGIRALGIDPARLSRVGARHDGGHEHGAGGHGGARRGAGDRGARRRAGGGAAAPAP
jgi:enoyl-CoA hydratase/carnithine racemase